ncbi:MAG: acetate--CoA ligase family protein [Acidocella sp.]|nr:acetate--CoA ligase family protein [Acidocella sp.]
MNAMSHKLRPLFDAKTLVIVGASQNYERTGGIPVNTALRLGFGPDRLALVNPRYREIAGFACHSDIASLPFTPDLAVLAVRASETMQTLRAAHAKGIPAAVLFASGFAEEHTEQGEALQREVVEFARETGMVISGPNCLGHANFRTQLFATFLKGFETPQPAGPVGVIAQSGNMAAIFMIMGARAGLGYSCFANTGNEACVEFSEYLEYLADDPGTKAVLGYVEQLRDGPRFLAAAARMREQAKPLFLLKVGDSEKAAEAAASHTAAMAGNAVVYKAALRQAGAAVGGDPGQIIDFARLWRTGRRPAGLRTCIVSVSGAGCAILSDRFAEAGLEIPTLPAEVQAKLAALLPRYGMWTNPVDLTGQVTNDLSFFTAALNALLETDALDCIVFYIMGYLLDLVSPALIEAAGRTGKLLVAIDPTGAERVAELEAAGVAVLPEIGQTARALGGYLDWAARSHKPGWVPVPHAPLSTAPYRTLNEAEAKSFLKRYGLPVVEERIATTADEAVAMAAELGCPVAVKVLSADILHKTEVGGVRLDLKTPEAAREAFLSVTESARKALPDARIEGATVQQQVSEGVGMLLGVTRDPVFGPVLTAGLGGVLTELYKDISLRLLPINRDIACEMLRELKAHPLLTGFRGAKPADEEALIEVMLKLSDMVMQAGSALRDVEINPVLVRPDGQGAVIVDALISAQI